MEKLIETSNGVIIERIFDGYNPRLEFDNLSTFFTWRRRNSSPDRHNTSTMQEWLSKFFSKKTAEKFDEIVARCGGVSKEFVEELIDMAKRKGYVLFPVCFYCDTYYIPQTNDDVSNFTGVIFVDKETLYKEYHKRISASLLNIVRKVFEAEVMEYSYYAKGEVYSYSKEDNDDILITFGSVSDNENVKKEVEETFCCRIS